MRSKVAFAAALLSVLACLSVFFHISPLLMLQYLLGFYRELMHNGSSRAGTLTLEGCTSADLLPR